MQYIEEKNKMHAKPDNMKTERRIKMDPFELGDMVFADQDSSLAELKKYNSNLKKSSVLRKFSKLQVH